MRIMPHFSAEGLSNVYLIIDEERNGIIIDPAHIDKELMELITLSCRDITAVLITHKHESHTAGLGTLMKIYNPRIYAYDDMVNGFRTESLADGDTVQIGRLSVKALHVPGHSLDSLAYLIDTAVFTGDTLHSGSIASTNSFVERALLIRSIEEKIMTLPPSTLLYPGHGTISKLGVEKMLNQDLFQFESETGAASLQAFS